MKASTVERLFAEADFQPGELVWHKADRERCGVVKAITLYSLVEVGYRVSWGDGEESEETLTVITDERPGFDGVPAAVGS